MKARPEPASQRGRFFLVDGSAPQVATIFGTNPNQGYLDWNSSGALNPSEHTIFATAQIHDAIGIVPLDSRRPECDGRAADDVIADLRLQSLGFTNNVLLNQDAVTPVPTPEFLWVPSSLTPTRSSPAAYIQAKKPSFTMQVCSSSGAALTGSATMGYALKLTATPNTVNPANNQPDPVLTLFDNTTGNPVVPTVFTNPTTVTATTPLNSCVAKYATNFSTLGLYVKFTSVPSWKLVTSYNIPTCKMYAVLAQPSSPMILPWTQVLDLACSWAARATQADAATQNLVSNEYLHCTYNGGFVADTAPPDDGSSGDAAEIFYLSDFLVGTTRPFTGIFQGQCDDFSDFLSCLSNAIGARPIKPQRSQTLAAINNSVDPTSITTNLLLAANALPPTTTYSKTWNYHQFTNDPNVAGGCIFDGCLRLNGTTIVEDLAGPAIGSVHYNALIGSTRHADPSKDWNPQPPLTIIIRNTRP